MKNQELAFRQLLMFLTWVRDSDPTFALRHYAHADGYLLGLYAAGMITGDQWCRLCDLARNALDCCGQPFIYSYRIGEVPSESSGLARDRLIMCKTHHVAKPSANFPGPAAAEAIPSPDVGPELHEHQPVPVLTEVVGRVDNDQVSKAAPRRDLYLLCVLVEPRSSALGFTPGRFAPVATMRRLPPLQDCGGRWSYDPSAWQVSANRIYVQCGTGLYLRQTPALPFKEILQRLRRRGQVLAATKQHGQSGAVCAHGENGGSVRSGVAA